MALDTFEVAVVGAGPAGLAVSCLLQAAGCRVTVIEARSDSANSSRATGLRYASLLLLEQIELRHQVVAEGCMLNGMQIYHDGVPTTFRNFPGSPQQPVDNLSVRQPALEAALRERALDLGVTMITGARVTGLQMCNERVGISCSGPSGDWTASASWVIAADGSRSTIRNLLGLDYDGEFEPDRSFVLDCRILPPLDPSTMHYFVSKGRRLAVMPLDAEGKAFKLSGSLPDEICATSIEACSIEKIGVFAREISGRPIEISDPTHFIQYRVSRRLASRLSVGRCFLIGDAAHSCPPNGGWGLNSALADAANLAWKLAGVVNGTLSETVLSSYARERRAVAASIIAFTEKQRQNTLRTIDHDAEEAEFLSELECDGEITVAPATETAWPLVTPGRNIWELAARRPELADILLPGAFSILSNHSVEAEPTWIRDLLDSMKNACLNVRLVSSLFDGPRQSALIRPDGVVAVVDVAPGKLIKDWIARWSTSKNKT